MALLRATFGFVFFSIPNEIKEILGSFGKNGIEVKSRLRRINNAVGNLSNTGAERVISERVVLLVLARSQEVLDTQDDAGNRAETTEEGYGIKHDQVIWALSKIKGADGVPVIFFDVLNDDPHQVTNALAAQIQKLRDRSEQRIKETVLAIDQLIQSHGEVQAKKAQAEVQRRLRIFIQQHGQLDASTQSLHDAFIQSVRGTHPRTVWATTTRNGTWPGLDAYLLLGMGTAINAQQRTQSAFAGLDELLKNMLGDSTLAPASDYLNELRRTAPSWKEGFISEATASGRENYRATLYVDDKIWDTCASLWGPGFRNAAAKCLQEWCEGHPELVEGTEKMVQLAWETHFLLPLAKLCMSEDLINH